MALMITEHCINCGYCLRECPNNAIYEPGMKWNMEDGTAASGSVIVFNALKADAREWLPPISNQYYYIAPDKCAECVGVYDTPQCIEVCPDPDSLIKNPTYSESKKDLLLKQKKLNPHLSLETS